MRFACSEQALRPGQRSRQWADQERQRPKVPDRDTCSGNEKERREVHQVREKQKDLVHCCGDGGGGRIDRDRERLRGRGITALAVEDPVRGVLSPRATLLSSHVCGHRKTGWSVDFQRTRPPQHASPTPLLQASK